MMKKKTNSRNFFYEKKGKRQQINGIAEISPEQLLISTQEGLTMFDIKESKFVDDSFSTAMHKIIASALYRQGDIIYIGTPVDGLYSYSIHSKEIWRKITPITDTKQIQAILQQSPTRIWIATEGAGLLTAQPENERSQDLSSILLPILKVSVPIISVLWHWIRKIAYG